jgi:hypothetical protein
MPSIPFPNVPNVPGVPAIPRSPNFPSSARLSIASLASSAIWRYFQVENKWGIFDKSGKPLADPSKFRGIIGGVVQSIGLGTIYSGLGSTLSTKSVEFIKETKVSDYPVEGGKFVSYNKVELPASPIVTFCFSGSETDRASFLKAINKACLSTDLFNVVTPEVRYDNYSIESYTYQRSNESGATMLTVEITLKEVRQVSAVFSSTADKTIKAPKNPSATPSSDGGRVQSKPPSDSVLKSIPKKIIGVALSVLSVLR